MKTGSNIKEEMIKEFGELVSGLICVKFRGNVVEGKTVTAATLISRITDDDMAVRVVAMPAPGLKMHLDKIQVILLSKNDGAGFIKTIDKYGAAVFDNIPADEYSIKSCQAYVKDDFKTIVQRTAEAKRKQETSQEQSLIEAAFSLAGELLDWAKEHVEQILPPGSTLQPGYVLARSTAKSVEKKPKKPQPVSQISKNLGDFTIEAGTYHVDNKTELEINVFKNSDNTEVRPLDINIFDTNGKPIIDPVHIDTTSQAPCFPDPSSGIYIFEISWPNGSGQIRLEFKE